MQFVLGHSFGLFLPKTLLDEPLVLSAQVLDKNNPKQRCNYFDCRFCESQNLVNFNPCEAPKFLLLFAFAKRRIPINSTNSNSPSKVDSQNLGENYAQITKFTLDSANRRICKKTTTNNRRGGGVAFVFVENFGLSTRLKSIEVQNFLQVRNCIPQNKLQTSNITIS